MTSKNTIAVIGLGYIGLPTAAILATHGADVMGVDVNPLTVESVNLGQVPFVEPDLQAHVSSAVTRGTLRASADTPHAGTYIVAVPTPFNSDRSADLRFIEAAATKIAERLVGDELIILESTSPPGTTQYMANFILALRPDLSLDGQHGRPQIHVAHCPERVLPGRVMIELVTNDRIIGGLTPMASLRAKAIYGIFCQGEMLLSDAKTAEMAKLVENSFRDVNIAFANELSMISDKLEIDVWELIRLANHHPRVNILQPGPGVGGHCIAVDPWFIVAAAPEEAKLIRTAREVNDSKPKWVLNKVLSVLEGMPDSVEIGILGLTFKANIDDLRESPALEIAVDLAKALPARAVNIAEPHIDSLPREFDIIPNTRFMSVNKTIERSQILLILVDHEEIKNMNLVSTNQQTIIDTRGIIIQDVENARPEMAASPK